MNPSFSVLLLFSLWETSYEVGVLLFVVLSEEYFEDDVLDEEDVDDDEFVEDEFDEDELDGVELVGAETKNIFII